MNRIATRSVAASAAAVVALVALLAVVAAGLGRADAADPTPSAPPVATPVASPVPVATPTPILTPTPAPTTPADGTFELDLDVATPDAVSVIVADRTGRVAGVSSGRAGDGMSVRWFEAKVENVDADTIRVTWVGLPGDVEIHAFVLADGDGIHLLIAQPEPPANSDATGHDRVLVLDFAGAVDAASVRATIQEGYDTAG